MPGSHSRPPRRSVNAPAPMVPAAYRPHGMALARATRNAVVAALLVLGTPSLPLSAPWAGKEVVDGGVTRVQNTATPMEKPLTLSLQELWRIGGDSEAEGEFFGLITDIAVHPSGEVYLVDTQLSEVKVFSPQGEYRRTIGREGEGPGEFRRPSTLFFDAAGNLGVVQTQPSRVVMFEPGGTPAAPFPLQSPEDGGFRMLQAAKYRGGSLVVQGGSFRHQEGTVERTNAIVRLGETGQELARFHTITSTSNMARMVIKEDEFGVPWTVGPQGDVYAALDRTWKISVWDPAGKLRRVISLDYQPLMRTAAEIDKRKKELGSRIQIRSNAGRIEPEFEVSDRERDVRWFAVTDDGFLWTLSSRGGRELPSGALGRFDVFDAQGRYVQQVTLNGDGSFEDDRFVLAGDRFFVIKEFAAAARAMTGAESDDAATDAAAVPMSVLCYKLAWSPARGVAASAR